MGDVEINQSDIEKLDDLDDDPFRIFIIDHLDTLPPANKQIWRTLCHPTLVDRTIGCLEELVDDLTAEVKRRALPAAHGKAKRLNIVKMRLGMANAAAASYLSHVHHVGDEVAMVKGLLRHLAFAVDAHRLACVGLDLAPEPHDLALWNMLDELRLVSMDGSGPGPSLAEQIVSGRWRQPVG